MADGAASSGQVLESNAQRDPLKPLLVGCPPDTGNRGVSALCFSLLSGIALESPASQVTVFDHGVGKRWGSAWMGDHALAFSLCGGRYSRRLHESRSLWNIKRCAHRGGLGNPAAMAILEADAILDVSGGDSFTDLYGARRFRSTVAVKSLALELGIPLILLPQTYGPYNDARRRREAQRLVKGASMAWARDSRSFDALREMLGPEYDPARHRCGVDLAFALPASPPVKPLPSRVEEWLEPDRDAPVVGVNVSGLIYNDPVGARTRYGFRCDYRSLVQELVGRFLLETPARVLLVTHVVSPDEEAQDDDRAACRAVLTHFEGKGYGSRIAVVGQEQDQSEIKHVIGRLDWFCGTRMHSTIAALSSRVPTASIAYSGKAIGVFDSCGQAEQVADPRALDARGVHDRIWESWCERGKVKESLEANIPGVIDRCRQQVRDLLDQCEGLKASGR